MKGVYGAVCILIMCYCLYAACKCSRKSKAIAGTTAKVCLAAAAVVLCSSVTLFFHYPAVLSVAFSCMLVCTGLFLYFLLNYTIQLTEIGPAGKLFRAVSGAVLLADSVLLLSNPWTNLVFELGKKIYLEELFYCMVPKLWYTVHSVLCYLIILLIVVVLLLKCLRIPLVYARPYFIELSIVTAGVLLNLLFVAAPAPLDLSGFLFGCAVWAAYHIALEYNPKPFRRQARYMMANKLQEPFLLFDINNLLADFNNEAAEKFGLSASDVSNMTREYFETNILQLTYEEIPNVEINREVVLQKEYATITYYMTLQILHSHRGLDMGIMYSFQNISKQKMMYNALENMTSFNLLTGFYTGRKFKEKIAEWDRVPEAYSIAVCNIACLKLINVFYGRNVGDRVIQRMSEELRKVLPEEVLAGHVDGECTVIIVGVLTEEQLNLYLSNAARKIKKRGLDNIPIFMNYGIARRENTAVSVKEYVKYAEMDLLLKGGKEGTEQKKEMTKALTEEYFRKEYESLAHVNRIKALSAAMADKLGLCKEEKEKLDLLCCYHDIGRVKTREEVWNRAAVITRDELDIIKLHSIAGYEMVSQLDLAYNIADLVLYHHENYDGSGYPYGLAGEQIPLLSRIFAIVDSYDVMVNNQLYKDAVSEEHAAAELCNHAGNQFDPALVTVFEEVLKERK